MTMKKTTFVFALLLFTACAPVASALPEDELNSVTELPSPTTAPTAEPTDVPEPTATAQPAADEAQTPNNPVQKVRKGVAESLGVSVEEVTVISAKAVTFSDSCLGAAAPGEMCLQVLTPGLIIVLDTPKGELTYHASKDGERFLPGSGEGIVLPES
jgi:hypothetical protein